MHNAAVMIAAYHAIHVDHVAQLAAQHVERAAIHAEHAMTTAAMIAVQNVQYRNGVSGLRADLPLVFSF